MHIPCLAILVLRSANIASGGLLRLLPTLLKGDPVGISRDVQDLLKTGWRFSLEIRESAVFVWVGDYAHRIAADAVFSSLEPTPTLDCCGSMPRSNVTGPFINSETISARLFAAGRC